MEGGVVGDFLDGVSKLVDTPVFRAAVGYLKATR